jgi:thioesterase domain-containing protein
VIGELYIGGHGVARGYWNRPDLTAERFVPDPFSKTLGARLYRTGDLARWRSDGTIECLGRIDHQVKIRGYRIELDEIEIALARYPGLRQAVVVARQDGSGERQLVAYLTTNEGGVSLATSDLRAFLAKGLPDYMVPSLFTVLPAFPLTPNGKVDHRALASLNLSPPVERRESALPRDPLEAAIAQIWEEILGCGAVGIDDDFFDLGGHSLLAVRMIGRVEQVCGPRLPVSTLFAGATIRHLAGALLEQNRESIRGLLAPIQDGGSRPPFFFLHGDLAGAGVYCRALAREIGPEQPFYVFHPHGLDGGSVPLTIEAMADEYLRTLRAFRPAGPYLLGGFCNGGLVAFEMARRLRAQGERVNFLLVFDSRGENARFRWLELLTKFLATVFRRPLGDRQRLFLTLRALTLAIERNLAVLRSHPLVVLRKAYRRWRGDQPTPRPVSNNNLFAAYGRAIFSYVPQRYSGRVALFLSMRAAEAGYDRDWRRVATELDVHVLPGTHTTVVTQHVQIVARCLRECLDAAQGHDAPGAKSKAAQPG